MKLIFDYSKRKEIPKSLKSKWNKIFDTKSIREWNYYILLGEISMIVSDSKQIFFELIQDEASSMHINLEFKIGAENCFYHRCYEGSVNESWQSFEVYNDYGYFENLPPNIEINFRLENEKNVIEINNISEFQGKKITEICNLLFEI